MDDFTKDTIPRSAVEYCLRKETVNTNPDAYEAHGKFIAYMDDPDISQFGHWMHSNGFNCALTTVKCDLDKIPSAQSEPCKDVQHILDYLDEVLHPLVSPEHWNVYSELHDMIAELPSAQPEQRWIPVSERLPEYGKSVLWYFKEDEDFGVNHVIDEEDGEWFIDGVTAWMPLPEPYREEGGE
jgi:hypothetical protein